MPAGDGEMEAVLKILRASSMTMDDIKRCSRIHTQDKICVNSIAKEHGFSAKEVEAACWAPPKPVSAFALYQSQMRSQVSGSMGDVMKQLGAQWRELGPSVKQRYEDQAAADAQNRIERLGHWEEQLNLLEKQKEGDVAEKAAKLAHDNEQAAIAAAEAAATREQKRAEAKAKPKTVTTSAGEIARAKHNAAVKEAKAEAAPRRAAFFRAHRESLQQFGAKIPSESETKGSFVMTAKDTGAVTPPSELTATMREYQLEGLRFLVNSYQNGVSVILGDEMGLGKTLQTIAFLSYLKFKERLDGPSLVIAPLSVLSSWLTEFKKFCPSLRVVKLHSSDADERERLKDRVMTDFTSFDVVVTTYEMAKSSNMSTIVKRLWWRYIILDEGHVIKNEESQISQAVRGFHYQAALLLTGTPLQNDLHELWALLNFLYPEIFAKSDAFDKGFNLSQGQVDSALLLKAGTLLKPLMIRRVKSDVEKSLPDKLETKIACGLSDCQRFWYKRLLLKDSSLLSKLEADSGANSSGTATDWKKLQSLMMQLRKCANHPFLFPDADTSQGNPEALVESSGKMQMLDRMLKKLHEKGHRCVLFSQFTSMLNLIEDYCKLRGWRYCRLDGSVNRVQRTVDISCFNAPSSPLFLFLMSTRAGGLGVNLQTADTCILYDSDWNPQPDLQAMARVHRIGQTKKVHVYRLVAAGTVEERIVQRAEKKLYLDQMVNHSSLMGGDSGEGFSETALDEDVSTSEMMKALKFGAQSIMRAQNDAGVSDEDIDYIIDRSRTGNESVGNLEGGTSHAAAEFNAEEIDVNLRELEGEVYGDNAGEKSFRNCKCVSDIAKDWQQTQNASREKKQRGHMEWVKGVGEVMVLNDNNYTMEQGMQLESDKAKALVATKGYGGQGSSKRQVAGRDYTHESHCLKCWDGGEIVMCDYCPCSYHPTCLGLQSADDIPSFGGWSCPHHKCKTCDRKSAAAGGLLFRCMMCPSAYCEDHLPEHACIVGRNPRLEALGFNHPKQGCYVFCSAGCVQFAHSLGMATNEVIQATAATVLGTTGVDLTKAPVLVKPRALVKDDRTCLEKLSDLEKEDLLLATTNHRCAIGELINGLEKSLTEGVGIQAVVQILYDALFETQGIPIDRATMVNRIKDWGGVHLGTQVEGIYPNISKKERQMINESAAELFLRLSRTLDDRKACEVTTMAHALGIMSLQKGGRTQPPGKKTKLLKMATDGWQTKESMSLLGGMRAELVPWTMEARHPMIEGLHTFENPLVVPSTTPAKKGMRVQVKFTDALYYAAVLKVAKGRNNKQQLQVRYADGSEEELKIPDKDVIMADKQLAIDRAKPPPKKAAEVSEGYTEEREFTKEEVDYQVAGYLGVTDIPCGGYPRGMRIEVPSKDFDLYLTLNNDFPKEIAQKKLKESVAAAKEIVTLNLTRYPVLGQSSRLQPDTVLYIPKPTSKAAIAHVAKMTVKAAANAAKAAAPAEEKLNQQMEPETVMETDAPQYLDQPPHSMGELEPTSLAKPPSSMDVVEDSVDDNAALVKDEGCAGRETDQQDEQETSIVKHEEVAIEGPETLCAIVREEEQADPCPSTVTGGASPPLETAGSEPILPAPGSPSREGQMKREREPLNPVRQSTSSPEFKPAELAAEQPVVATMDLDSEDATQVVDENDNDPEGEHAAKRQRQESPVH